MVPSFADPKNPQLGMFHAHYDSDPTPLFDAPVTEFVIATVKSGVSVEEARAAVDGIAKKIAAASSAVGVTVGKIEESPERFVIVVGHQQHQVRPVKRTKYRSRIN